jgi:dihydroxyacetone kinase
MKKLINRPGDVVGEMVEGLVAVYPGLVRLPGRSVIVRADAEEARRSRVAVVSGGGSGHEPAHAGHVGRGMLSAAVLGDVFTSPAPDAVRAALRAVTGPPGALLVVKNYTGDRLNFGLAAELARAEGLNVETVVVADDVALAGTAEAEHVGRRGLAGTVLRRYSVPEPSLGEGLTADTLTLSRVDVLAQAAGEKAFMSEVFTPPISNCAKASRASNPQPGDRDHGVSLAGRLPPLGRQRRRRAERPPAVPPADAGSRQDGRTPAPSGGSLQLVGMSPFEEPRRGFGVPA